MADGGGVGGGNGVTSRRGFLGGALAFGAVALGACTTGTNDGAAGAGSSATTTGTAAPAITRPRPDEGSRTRAVVVGAGLAGLTAALDLVDAGWDVVVLEARDRVGGRVHTLYEPWSDGLHAEGGGESIDDDHHDLLALIRRFGLRTEDRPEGKEELGFAYVGGRRLSMADFLGGDDGQVLADYLRFAKAIEALGEEVDAEHPERSDRAEELDGRSLADFITEQRLVPDAELMVRNEQRGELNAEPEQISLLFAAQQEAAGADARADGAETMRVAGGNSTLLEAMADALGDRVVRSAPLERVRWSDDGVSVDAGGRTYDAARLVVACPFVPLRQVAFEPALPADLAAAVAGLDLGSAAKVATQYERRFWTGLGGGAEASTAFTVTDLPFGIAWESTDSMARKADGPGIVAQFITGDAARDAAGMTDADRIARFQAQLDEVYPEGVPLRTGNAATVAWALERYTGGGYGIWRPGEMTRFWAPVRQGVGPIRFAGEHTEALAGYMESAVRSGHRVAAAIGAPQSR